MLRLAKFWCRLALVFALLFGIANLLWFWYLTYRVQQIQNGSFSSVISMETELAIRSNGRRVEKISKQEYSLLNRKQSFMENPEKVQRNLNNRFAADSGKAFVRRKVEEQFVPKPNVVALQWSKQNNRPPSRDDSSRQKKAPVNYIKMQAPQLRTIVIENNENFPTSSLPVTKRMSFTASLVGEKEFKTPKELSGERQQNPLIFYPKHEQESIHPGEAKDQKNSKHQPTIVLEDATKEIHGKSPKQSSTPDTNRSKDKQPRQLSIVSESPSKNQDTNQGEEKKPNLKSTSKSTTTTNKPELKHQNSVSQKDQPIIDRNQQSLISLSAFPTVYTTKQKQESQNHQAIINPTPARQENLKPRDSPQQCVLPNLDPFHPDIQQYIKDEWRNAKKCGIKRHCQILPGGRLKLKLNSVQRAGFYYIQRVDDFNVKLSKWHPLKREKEELIDIKDDQQSCLRVFQGNRAVIIQKDGSLAISDDRQPNCPPSRRFIFRRNGQIFQAISNKCLQNIGETLRFTNTSACNNKNSVFLILHNGNIKHVASNKCILQTGNTFRVERCDPYSTRFFVQPTDNKTQTTDIDTEIQLEADLILVDVIHIHESTSEFHMFPVRKKKDESSENSKQRKDGQLNVIMVMSDSISRSDARRYMKKTYAMLEKNPDSVILEGHTINGDGTTPQLCTLLVGKQEHELPEARRGFPNSQTVDRWNFIFNDFRQKGYETLFNEDEAWVNTFHYRLQGFKNPPTDKYLRPWWLAVDRYVRENSGGSVSCPFELAFEYLRNFLQEYKDIPSFSYTVSSALTHQEPARIALVDSDIVDLFTFLEKSGYRNNSMVIIHGDHGDTTSKFRSTVQGKLEERLPFLSITLPPWFKKSHPEKFRNLKRNSKLLTTYYDVYTTFKDILGIDTQHKYGTSLFSDMTHLNRTCQKAGIDEHWCPCLTYTKADITDSIVQTIAVELVQNINKRFQKYNESKTQCDQLRLSKVLRASRQLPNEKVQLYEKTYRTSQCDNCEITLNSNFTANEIRYEIVFEVLPSNGLFEGSVEYNSKTSKITVNENISRLNMYGKQPECIAMKYPYLRPFCYCRR